jgi:hypothetical protein
LNGDVWQPVSWFPLFFPYGSWPWSCASSMIVDSHVTRIAALFREYRFDGGCIATKTINAHRSHQAIAARECPHS